jgi:hypothetical protein
MLFKSFRWHFPLAVAALLCVPEPGSARSLREILTGEHPAKEAPGSAKTAQLSQSQRQSAFLARIRKTDPNRKTIERAIFNRQNELGLVLGRSVPMGSVSALMKTMLTQMAKDFPGQDLTIVAYAPSNPPIKVGTAHLNARTRDMTYTPAR